jgi:putative transposase
LPSVWRPCGRALRKAEQEIFNTNQGSRFTGEAFTGLLLRHGVKISMGGRVRCADNAFVERPWRGVMYERGRYT